MTKRYHSVSAMLAVGIILGSATVQAEDYLYETNNGEITITRYIGPGGEVTIPSEINGLQVISIGKSAFAGDQLYPNTSLTSITIPNGVTSIGVEAFYWCTSLSSVSIPSSVTNIGTWAFCYGTSLTAITVDTNNPAFSSVDGVLFDKSQSSLLQYPARKVGMTYAIPSTVTIIEREAFSYCTNLTNVTIPNSVTSIGNGAFAVCTSLTNISIPNSVTSIGDSAFNWCTSLMSITIPDGVTSIGVEAFYYCLSLTNVIIGNSVTNIGDGVFLWCTALTSMTIPDSVTSIGSHAFGFCTNMTFITVEPLNHVFSSVDGVLFDKSQTTLVACPAGRVGSYASPNRVTTIGAWAFEGCSSLTSVIIPDSVNSIGNLAFNWCTSLTSITIPISVTNIGYLAFNWCTSLTGVYFKGNAPTLGYYAFEGATNVILYYLPGTSGWGATYEERPTAPWVLPNPQILTTAPNFGVQTNAFGFRISWATNASVVVEASTTLANPIWLPVSTNTLVNGWSDFSDAEWTNYPARFYRIRQW